VPFLPWREGKLLHAGKTLMWVGDFSLQELATWPPERETSVGELEKVLQAEHWPY
jgi:hypothetical protein